MIFEEKPERIELSGYVGEALQAEGKANKGFEVEMFGRFKEQQISQKAITVGQLKGYRASNKVVRCEIDVVKNGQVMNISEEELIRCDNSRVGT